MKKRLITAVLMAIVGVAVGLGISVYQKQQANMLGITLATAGVGFFFGLVFKVKMD